MLSLKSLSLALAASLPGALGASLPLSAELLPRQAVAPSGPNCGNTATTRGSWCPSFDINTDYDLIAPSTGNSVTVRWPRLYHFSVAINTIS